MKKVLIVAYYFPPLGGIGVLRSVKFAKYLPEFGWEPVVLTVEHGDSFSSHDQSLQTMLPEGSKIYRARSWEPFKATKAKKIFDQMQPRSRQSSAWQKTLALLKSLYFSLYIPDGKIGWLPFASKLGKQIIQQEDIDLIFATAPPYTSFLVGRSLKQHTGRPLVLDYRDEWTTIRYREISTNPFTSSINRRLERMVLKEADATATVTEYMQGDLQQAQLLPLSSRCLTIPNGFDPDDYEQNKRSMVNRKFSIVYTGSFYGAKRRPDNFLHALSSLLHAHPDIRDEIEVIFVGNMEESHIQCIEETGLKDVVQVKGFLPHRHAIGYQLLADVLLLIVNAGEGSEALLTGKVCEYVGAGRQILALAPTNGAAADLVNRSRTGITVDPDDIEGISQAIYKLYLDWANGQMNYQPDMSVVNRYSRRVLTEKLAGVFDECLSE